MIGFSRLAWQRKVSAMNAAVASQQFTTQTLDIIFNPAPDSRNITVIMDLGDWPDGQAVSLELFLGGISRGKFQTGGDVVRNKSGTPTGLKTITTWTAPNPLGLTDATVRCEFLQTLTSGIVVERTA